MDFSAHPLVETAWLEAHLSDDDLCIVDASWRGDGTSRALYQRGHLPGAVHLDWHHDLSWTDERGVRDLLLPTEPFAAVMEAVGIGDQTRVVAYAETDHSGAARLWWALRFYGHEQVVVLNGGWTKWVAEGRPVSTENAHPVLARFTPRPQRHWLATAAEIERALSEPTGMIRLLDARPPEQYAGQAIWTPQGSCWFPPGQDWLEVTPGRLMRGGHIPGAIHLQASRMLDPDDWTYRPAETIREQARAVGLEPEQQIITYCGVGISASLALFALYLAGYRQLALYDASWEEWGTDQTRPVEREER
ncbi:MAG: sulfurtransferase [Ktedonobacteraceae bacterium]